MEMPTGYHLAEVVKDDIYWASHAAPTVVTMGTKAR
jgi:hypothetical protein